LLRFAHFKEKFPGLLFIPGAEASPFFYWEGSPLSKRCAIIDYYKQFLIIGLNRDYQDMPVVGNRKWTPFSGGALFSLWPLLLVIFGLKLFRKKGLAISLILAGILLFINNLPFPASRFNVYQGQQGVKPYQDLIDYVNRKGGLIFWAHPQAFSQKAYFGIELSTLPHFKDLLLTSDYTGFGLMGKDESGIAEPGEIWDKMLLEYIQGRRKKPVWIIGVKHFTGETGPIDYVETVFFLKEVKEDDLLSALREGRMYVRFNLAGEPVILNEFSVKHTGFGSIQINIKVSRIPAPEPIKIELIRNGQAFKKFEETHGQRAITVEDSLLAGESKVYYRLKISSDSSIIFTNPIFVEIRNQIKK